MRIWDGAAHKARVFWPTVVLVAVGDVWTKAAAQTFLAAAHTPRRVLGDVIRLTLIYNPGAAFGLHLGPHSRWIFLALALVALAVLRRMYRSTAAGQTAPALALGLVSGGAVANVINRLWSERGVVDFIDAGIGDLRWPAFNLADSAITVGAVLLAWTLWREGNLRTPGRADAGGPRDREKGARG